MAKTNKQDVINNFSKYLGRQPTTAEIAKYTVQDPATLIKDLTATKAKIEAGAKKTISTKSTTSTSTKSTSTTISPADVSWINSLYQQFFDRTATSAEIANWAKQTPQSLTSFLQQEKTTNGYVSKADGEVKKANYDAAMKTINDSNLPPDIKKLWSNVVGLYPDAKDFNAEDILSTFNQIKANTIDPYFKELADVATKDFQNTYKTMQADRAAELVQEQAKAQGQTEAAQQGLEATGMTFTGQGVQALGQEGSAYGQGQPNQQGMAVTDFAGLAPQFQAGTVNQANKLIAQSSASRYQQDLQKLGSTAEQYLGGAGATGLGIPYSPLGVNQTGTLSGRQQDKYGSTLNDIISNWQDQQKLKTNISTT